MSEKSSNGLKTKKCKISRSVSRSAGQGRAGQVGDRWIGRNKSAKCKLLLTPFDFFFFVPFL